MRSAKLTMRKKRSTVNKALFLFLSFSFSAFVLFAQDNSPYSRYGLGDVVPNTNIVNRAMGGITAGYSDFLSINFNNPATYSNFQTIIDARSKAPVSGRVLLDVGTNIENRTIRSPNRPEKFTSSNALFSYVQIGVPLRKNWGFSFGLRPLSRVSYKVNRNELLKDPISGASIDSSFTQFSGEGGSYLPSIGTGIALKNFSVGGSIGYLFGNRQTSTRRSLRNDSVFYNNSNHTTRSSFGSLFFTGGAQYKIPLSKEMALRLGASGNLKTNLRGSQDIVRETFVRDASNGDFRQDSVFEQTGVRGDVVYPSSYTMGVVLESQKAKGSSWLLGIDLVQNKWDDFRFFGTKDPVQNNWQLRTGGQFRPEAAQAYLSNVTYRAGFYTGRDYVTAGGDLSQWGASFGVGLPVANYSRLSPGQYTIINLTVEYNKRGNNNNLLKENTFRISAGLNFSDLWFNKRKYD